MRILVENHTMEVTVTRVDRDTATVVQTWPEDQKDRYFTFTVRDLLTAVDANKRPHAQTVEEIQEAYDKQVQLIHMWATDMKLCADRAAIAALKGMGQESEAQCEAQADDEMRKIDPTWHH